MLFNLISYVLVDIWIDEYAIVFILLWTLSRVNGHFDSSVQLSFTSWQKAIYSPRPYLSLTQSHHNYLNRCWAWNYLHSLYYCWCTWHLLYIWIYCNIPPKILFVSHYISIFSSVHMYQWSRFEEQIHVEEITSLK